MRRHIVLLLLLALALPAVCAAAEDGETTFIDFPELSFTTLADFDCIAQVEGDRELFLYTGTVESMPYYYIWNKTLLFSKPFNYIYCFFDILY